jgi:hypothetical protein
VHWRTPAPAALMWQMRSAKGGGGIISGREALGARRERGRRLFLSRSSGRRHSLCDKSVRLGGSSGNSIVIVRLVRVMLLLLQLQVRCAGAARWRRQRLRDWDSAESARACVEPSEETDGRNHLASRSSSAAAPAIGCIHSITSAGRKPANSMASSGGASPPATSGSERIDQVGRRRANSGAGRGRRLAAPVTCCRNWPAGRHQSRPTGSLEHAPR